MQLKVGAWLGGDPGLPRSRSAAIQATPVPARPAAARLCTLPQPLAPPPPPALPSCPRAQVLAGARLPESEEEWSALRTALAGVRKHLRPDTSVERLHAELRDFVGMVVDWWGNRKKTEQGGLWGVGRALRAGVLHQAAGWSRAAPGRADPARLLVPALDALLAWTAARGVPARPANRGAAPPSPQAPQA